MRKKINGKQYELHPEQDGNDLCIGCAFDQIRFSSFTRCAISGETDIQDCITNHGIWKEVKNE